MSNRITERWWFRLAPGMLLADGARVVRSFNHAEPHLLDQDAELIRDLDWTSANPKPR